jgi:hypothetical protein
MTPAFLAKLEPRTLRELAAVIEYRSPRARARRELTPEGIEKLADILLAGSQPTCGFFLKNRRVS